MSVSLMSTLNKYIPIAKSYVSNLEEIWVKIHFLKLIAKLTFWAFVFEFSTKKPILSCYYGKWKQISNIPLSLVLSVNSHELVNNPQEVKYVSGRIYHLFKGNQAEFVWENAKFNWRKKIAFVWALPGHIWKIHLYY